MTPFFNFAARTPVIVVSFIAVLAIGYGFSMLQDAMGGTAILDMTADPDVARAQLAAMTDEAKRIHLIGTLTLDVAYPLSLLTLMSGLIFRFGPGAVAGPLSYIPVIAAVVDFVENATIVLILTGQESLIGFKSLATQAKFPLFYVAGIIALLCLVYAIGKRVMGKSST